jgi:hypothetical protein
MLIKPRLSAQEADDVGFHHANEVHNSGLDLTVSINLFQLNLILSN